MQKQISLAVLLATNLLIPINALAASSTVNTLSVAPTKAVQDTGRLAQNTLTLSSGKPRVKTAFSVFKPGKQTNSARIDYEVLDIALHDVVLGMGQSVRIRERRPQASTGTRFVKGHTSPYRLEGSRVMFSYISQGFTGELTAYRKDLVNVANNVDLQSLSSKEQLAFWFNLHNVLLIETISKNYPKKRPREIKIGANNKNLHDAKIITINGVPLSLRNIREDIVYQNWNNPNVIYGFFLGDIGGPGLMNYAITSTNVDYIIKQNGFEFVNSLRGFHTTGSSRKVSKIYENTKPYFFQNWPQDIEAHLKSHATDDVLKEIAQDKPYQIARYDRTVADLMAGDSAASFFNTSVNGYASDGGVPLAIRRLAGEMQEKTKRMRKRGMLQGLNQVIITDFETVDVDLENVEEKP